MTATVTSTGVVAIVIGALLLAVLVAYLLTRRDPLLRRVRVGVFVERERFEDELERGFDEDPAVERRWPPDDA